MYFSWCTSTRPSRSSERCGAEARSGRAACAAVKAARSDERDVRVERIERILGVRFGNPSLCIEALTHRSAAAAHNERLEFLGDACLNCVVAQALYEACPAADEGRLSRMRASLVSGAALAELATELGIGESVQLGMGEATSGGRRRASILANTLEAILGALFLDAGFDAASMLVQRLFMRRIASVSAAAELKDPKSQLQEQLQARGLPPPTYATSAILGRQHAQDFAVTCEVPSLELKTAGAGTSRRRAEQSAAALMLTSLSAAGPRT